MDTKPNSTEQAEAINISELFYALLGKSILILIVTAVFGILAFSYSKFLVAPQYKASCTLFVLNRNSENSLTSSDISTSNALLKDYEILATSRKVVDKVIDELNLRYDEANPNKPSYSYGELTGEISVAIPQDSRMLVVSVTDRNTKNSKTLVDKLADVLVEQITNIMKTEAVVVDYSVLPASPSSPNVKRNTIIGAAFGFLLAAAFVVIRYLTDDSIKTDTDVDKYLHVPVLGTIPLEENEVPKRKRSDYRKDTRQAKQLYFGKRGN